MGFDANFEKISPQSSAQFMQEDGNGEKLTVKKWWLFGCRFFHGLVPIFFTVYADFSRFVRDINGEKKNISLVMIFFTVSFSRFAPSRSMSHKEKTQIHARTLTV